MSEIEKAIDVISSHTQHFVPRDDLEALYIVVAAAEKLAEYETAEEEGRLVILPCKIGTIVYAIRQSWYGYVIDKKRFSYEMIGKIGRSVFFTCEEAEKALEERNDT